jgi:hypothetical protein
MTFDLSDQILRTLIASALQIGVVAIIIKVVLFAAQRLGDATFNTIERSFGYKKMAYTTGWIGVPLHEFSHLLACKIFRLDVAAVKFFEPDGSGTLGYVQFNHHGTFMNRVGCFVVGIAPLISGISVILVLGLLLVPGVDQLISRIVVASFEINLLSVHAYLLLMGQASLEGFRLLFNIENLLRWQFWVFLYVSSCISIHLSPCYSDQQIARAGITSAIILVIIGNAIAAALWFNPLGYTLYWGKFLGVTLSLLGLAMGMSLIYCIAAHVITLPVRILR